MAVRQEALRNLAGLADVVEALRRFIDEHAELFTWLFSLSAAMLVLAILLAPVVFARMPADYFVREGPPLPDWLRRHPPVHFVLRLLRNALGFMLLAAGIAMLVLPGQGLLTILLALGLVDFPGKRRVELWMIRRRSIYRTITWIRRRRGRPPLELPARREASAQG